MSRIKGWMSLAVMLSVLGVALMTDGLKAPQALAAEKAPPALDFKMKSLEGKEVDLADYKGKVILMVNVASKCGLTPQYKELQALHEKYADKGLAILGFPCNQFREQEPGTAEEIRLFCTEKYGVSFDMFAKIEVNGDSAAPLYKHLTSLDLKPKGAGEVSWNFEKFLIDRDGQPVARFEPRTRPNDEKLVSAIETELKE